MSHFLARLVERARGTAPRVEPIIAPRFAPADSLGADAPPEIATEIESPEVNAAAQPNEPPFPSAKPNGADDAKIGILAEPLLVPQVHERVQSLVVRQTHAQPDAVEPARELNVPGNRPAKQRTGRANREATWALVRRYQADQFPHELRDEAPIVRVTIGRIDVRAAPAPVPPPRKTALPSPPKLTLDAYLKSRKEGAR
jgi:hypothetical protein